MACLYEIKEGVLRFHLHPGQTRAWESDKRIVAMIAGTQGGKSEFQAPWLWREMQRRGPGDYLVVGPNYPLLDAKSIPSFKQFFCTLLGLGIFRASRPVFVLSERGEMRLWGSRQDIPTKVIFGHADKPESLEAATAKAAVCDEAGQKQFKVGSWEAIQRRLAIYQGRCLIGTTPYNFGWLKQLIYDEWEDAGRNHPEIDVIQFASTENPSFPMEEFERAKKNLPLWKFNMFYRGQFTQPAGLIYDSFLPNRHVIPKWNIPADWQRYIGLDFGGVNTAAVFFARDPKNGRLHLYREYHAGGRTAAEHVKEILKDEPGVPVAVGGAASESQWRDEFAAAGLPVLPPAVKDVEVGINRVYAAHRRDLIFVFRGCKGYLDQKGTYSRKVNDRGEPTEEIENKSDYHLLDAERYIIGWLLAPQEEEGDDLEGYDIIRT